MKKLKIGNWYYPWTWVESVKFLSAAGGFMGCLTIIGIIIAKYNPDKRMMAIGLSVASLALAFVIGYFVNYIIDQNFEEE